jgi:hypothetical protein
MSLSGVYQSTALYSGVLFHIQETLVLNMVSFTSYPDRIPNKFQNSEIISWPSLTASHRIHRSVTDFDASWMSALNILLSHRRKINMEVLWGMICIRPRLKVSENRVLRRIFGTKRDEATGEWRKLRYTLMICTPHPISFGWSNREEWDGRGM